MDLFPPAISPSRTDISPIFCPADASPRVSLPSMRLKLLMPGLTTCFNTLPAPTAVVKFSTD